MGLKERLQNAAVSPSAAISTVRDGQGDRALRCADEMAIQASQHRQAGFTALADWLDENAKKARVWAVGQLD